MPPDGEVLPQTVPDEGLNTPWDEYWHVLLANRWTVLSITGITFLLSLVYYSMLPNRYTAAVRVLVEKVDATQKSYQEIVLPSSRGEEDYYGTQMAILTGSKIRNLVQQELSLKVSYEVRAKREKGTRIILLSITHRDPEMASQIANKIAETYVNESSSEKLFMSQQLLKWIPEEGELEFAGDATDAASPAGGSLVNLSEDSKKEFVQSLASITYDPLIREMKNEKLKTEFELRLILQRYKPSHPSVKELEDRIRYVDQQINERTKRIVSNLKANLSGAFDVKNIKILEYALPPAKPSSPDRPRGIFMGTLFGLVLACGFVLSMEYMNQKIRTQKDLDVGLNIPFLGYIPITKDLQKGSVSGLPDLLRKNQSLADAVASTRTHILFSMPYERSKRIMLTSAVPGEGKSTAATFLALSLSSLGRKILLIDADVRKPTLHTYLGMQNTKGLTDFLVGAASIDEIIQSVPDTTLKIITGGNPTLNPSELLSSERFRELLDTTTEAFDRMVIDVPPVLYLPDGLVVAKHVHSGVLVCGSGMVQKKVVKTVRDKFESIGHAFIGIIINRADFDKQGFRFKYYSTYKSYYLEGKKAQPVKTA